MNYWEGLHVLFTVCPFRNNLSYFIARLAEREGWVVRPGSGAGCNVMLGLGSWVLHWLHSSTHQTRVTSTASASRHTLTHSSRAQGQQFLITYKYSLNSSSLHFTTATDTTAQTSQYPAQSSESQLTTNDFSIYINGIFKPVLLLQGNCFNHSL